jgi:putative ABC transport system permease protein
MQLNYHFTFDRFRENSDKIFRMEVKIHGHPNMHTYSPGVSRPFAEAFFQSSPHILAGVLDRRITTHFFYVENDGVRNHFHERVRIVTPEFFDVFSIEIIDGSIDGFITDGHLIVPQSLAQRMFGDEPAAGRLLTYSWGTLPIAAVYRDFPSNSIFENTMFHRVPPDDDVNNWLNWNYFAYIRVNDASNIPALVEVFNRNFDIQAFLGPDAPLEHIEEAGFSDVSIRFTPLTDIHFLTDVLWDGAPKGNRQTLMILLAIAIVIILIASINFTNFSTALSPMRVKKINTQRVLGAKQSAVRLTLVFEAVAFSLVSYGIALLLVHFFTDSEWANLVTANLAFSAQHLVVFGTAAVALLVGILAGIYPALYMTSFAPALALKGNAALSPKGKRLRNTLIAIQYVASFVLIICASFMYLQNRFFQNADLGYDYDRLIGVEVWRLGNNRDAFFDQVKTHPAVEDIVITPFFLSLPDFDEDGWPVQYRGEEITFNAIAVPYNFLDVVGIEITEGRNFRIEDTGSETAVLIFNETARRRFNMEVNTFIEDPNFPGEIVGFMSDAHISSLRSPITPTAFFIQPAAWGQRAPTVAYIRIAQGVNMNEMLDFVRTTIESFEPGFPFVVRNINERVRDVYESERNLSILILIFSLIAIFISIVGVFGLVVFDSECRRKEIGIRKVVGATAAEIVLMFNKAYFKILAVCFVVATPIAWFAVSRWLENFAFRTPMYWWVFALAFVAVAAITVLTVTIQNWRVANDDPVKSVKTE